MQDQSEPRPAGPSSLLQVAAQHWIFNHDEEVKAIKVSDSVCVYAAQAGSSPKEAIALLQRLPHCHYYDILMPNDCAYADCSGGVAAVFE